MNKFWKYFLIVLLLILGLAMVGILYLFFIPGSNLFNITYISLNVQGTSSAYDSESVIKITIENRDYPVSVVQSSSDTVSVKVYSNSLGFTLVKNSTVSISSNISDGELTFTISEPYGLVSKGDSYIQLRVPENYTVNLNLQNRNASVTLDKKDLTVKNLYYKATAGEFDFSSGAITGTLDLELNKSNFTISSEVQTSDNAVVLNSQSGSFYATSSTLGEVTIASNDRGVFMIGACEKLIESVTTAGGRIHVGTLVSVNIRTSDTNVYITTLTDGGTVQLTKSGSIEIGTTEALTDLITNTGSITVNSAQARLYAYAEDGSITVKSALTSVNAQTTYGDITVTFSEEAGHYTSSTLARSLEAITDNGLITATGVENLVITINNKGRANIEMDNVLGTSSVSGKAGSVYIKIDKDAEYVLTTKSDSGNVSVDLLQLDVTLGSTGYTTKEETTTYVNINTTNGNSLVVTTTSGDLTIRDTGV